MRSSSGGTSISPRRTASSGRTSLAACLSVSNSLSGRHWEMDQGPAVGDRDSVQLGTGHHGSVGEGQRRVALQRRVAAYLVWRRPDARRHATLPQSWIQRENWEFETHRRGSAGSGRSRWRDPSTAAVRPAGRSGSDHFRGQPHRHIAASNEGLVARIITGPSARQSSGATRVPLWVRAHSSRPSRARTSRSGCRAESDRPSIRRCGRGGR